MQHCVVMGLNIVGRYYISLNNNGLPIIILLTKQKKNFYAPISKDRGHIVLPLSVCPSVCLHKQNMKT